MDKDIRQMLDEEFQRQLSKLQAQQPKEKGEIANMRQQSLAGISKVNIQNFCSAGPKVLKSIEDEITGFAWFIPDNIEVPALAVLRTLEVILPEICKIGGVLGAGTEAPAKGGVKKNFT